MATVALTNPYFMKNALLSIASDNFEAAVASVEFVPSSSAVTFNGIDGGSKTEQTVPTWVCNIGYVQDWATSGSLARYLLANIGESVAVVFTPTSGSGPSFSNTVTITTGSIGGTANAYGTTTASLGCSGPPTLTESGAVPTIVTALPSAAAETEIVTITGTGFTGTTAVTFGGTAASDFVVLSSTVLVATMPAGSAGSAAIIVTNATGASSSFTYTRGA